MRHQQYIPNARAQYDNWDDLGEVQQQRVLNSLYAEHRHTNPQEAERLRQAQYRSSKRQKSEVLSERTGTLEQRVERLEKKLAFQSETMGIMASDITRLFEELEALKNKAIFASVL